MPSSTRCTVPIRASYCNLNQPRAFGDNPAKYSVSAILDKGNVTALAKIEAAMHAAYEEGLPILQGKSRTAPSYEEVTKAGPLHDGDEKSDGDPAYKNAYYLNAKNNRKPIIVDSNKNEIIDPSEIYSGVYGKAALSFFAFNKNGNRGISVSIEAFMKTKDGEPLGSTVNIDEAFADDDDDDFLA